MALAAVSLDDKYAVEQGRIFLNGTQALARLPMMQRRRDEAAGLNTGGFISGYRGSPLGGLDRALWAARKFLDKHHITFQPGVNEDLAATAIWGSQQVNLFPGAKYDGVFALWYGKGPGVDRSGDPFKHANGAGTSPYGGVLVVAGDDHACKSSTLPHQSEFALMDASIPVLAPSSVQDILDLGLHGWAMSRYSGCWIGFKVLADTVDSSASVSVDPHRLSITLPEDFQMPLGGVGIRWPDPPLVVEKRLREVKLPAVLAYARANKLDRVVIDGPKARLGIATSGKSYLDVRQALSDLGISEEEAASIGIRLYKIALTWPLEPEGLRRFADGLDEILVVEEKRSFLETQIKEELYTLPDGIRPRIVGKTDETGAPLLSPSGELTPSRIARAIARRLAAFHSSPRITERIAFLDAKDGELKALPSHLQRVPHFCSGCPHNTSTKVPEGSRAMAGIGCHYMAIWMDRRTETFTQMGGEGTPWIGQAPFTEEKHVFVNIGDGTYFHSGLLAIRAAVTSGVNITYKLLYNDAVAMTGGQPVDGELTVAEITRQVAAEGVKRVVVVTDEPDKYPLGEDFAPGVTIHGRDKMDEIQRDLRETLGTTVLVYDQTCAAEKRRRRKRGDFPDPDKRVFINEEVCEGCGDCSKASNCLSVVPVETEFGRKRAIDQSSCNKDFSCIDGFCPSFVTVHGAKAHKRAAEGKKADFPDLPEPALASLDHPYQILVTGVGGTGVLTIGALIAMAAHLEGKGCSVLDMTGLAQKGGAVLSHVKVARSPEEIHAARITVGSADLLLGDDLLVAGGQEGLSKLRQGVSRALINHHETITAAFTRDPDVEFPGKALTAEITQAVGPGNADFIDATRIATVLLGDSIAANLFMLGYAYQKGWLPVSGEALDKAIELNGVAVTVNRQAFLWGRRAAHDPVAVESLAAPHDPGSERLSQTLRETVKRRVRFLTDYQNEAYATRYSRAVNTIQGAEKNRMPGSTALTEAVAKSLFKLMAYKDEYEVARLYTDGTFDKRLKEQFDGKLKLEFHLAPPLFAERDPVTGHLKKRSYGPWMMKAFRLLAKMRVLRGTTFDPFGYSGERKAERALVTDYLMLVEEMAACLSAENHAVAVELALLPQQIRGFGHVKEANLAKVRLKQAELLDRFRLPPPERMAAE